MLALHRALPFIWLPLALLGGCSSGTNAGTFSDASADSASTAQPQEEAGSPPVLDGGEGRDGGDGGPVRNGNFTFTVNGKAFAATSIAISETSGYYQITAIHEDGDGIYYDAVAISYAKASNGSGPCGSILGLPDRTVTYGRYFRTGGQIATDKQYLSGLPQGPSCDLTIAGHSPESGSATGALTNDKALTGGAVLPPVNVVLQWSGIQP